MSTVEESWGCAPHGDTLLKIADKVLSQMRPFFPDGVGQINIFIDELPDEETLEALYLDDPYALYGAYSGMTSALELHEIEADARIWIYRLPILKHWVEAADIALETLIANVFLKEIASHYRWEDVMFEHVMVSANIPQIMFE
ncbi:metallopeptidase family protein [Hirschia baltica]|uniref:Uncharacterized protein n=1 Tax=Hirschia baltica (strain ATCC 49814 / DSM 5838 / IFAM 1418) TaxID=582402 RepID=C6XRS9_HIRBI|nr:metallopeptidase family protein [Hirschia baltica]ACT60689.1 protein of unknown function DUF1025 [Hirschia baltica ATCC 49814]